jgi:hypothetical protein
VSLDFLVANTPSRSMLRIAVIKQKVRARIRFRNYLCLDFLVAPAPSRSTLRVAVIKQKSEDNSKVQGFLL